MEQAMQERLAIRETIENWAIWRDAGDWERFRTVWAKNGRMEATWKQGTADEFIAASIAGWEDYLTGDPGPAHALILQRNSEMTPELLEFSRGELILRALVSGDRARGEEVGRIALARIADQMRTLAELGMLDAHIDLSLVASTEFLPAVTP